MTLSSTPKQAGSITGLLTFLLVAVLLAGAILVRLVGEDETLAPLGATSDAAAVARQPAPDFTLPDPDGRQKSLSDWRGQPVLLNFWATWCGPCEVEMPALQAAYNEHQADGLVVLAVAVDDSADDVRRFFDRHGLTFHPLLDDGTTARQYQVFGLPTSFFIDADGQISVTHVGMLTAQSIESYLSSMADDE